jgi:hypothetical protein
MKSIMLPAFFLFIASLLSSPAMAAEPCEVVLCMYGKATGNVGGKECRSAERSFFNIVKMNKNGFARKAFLLECQSADTEIVSQIISKFGRMRS